MLDNDLDLIGCIWCGKQNVIYSIEHILPEALGCPPNFLLKGAVCAECNNGLAYLDQALLKQYELITFFKGVPRKKGKAPTVESWAAMRGRRGPHGPEFMVNAGPGRCDAWGKPLAAANASNGITDAKIERFGDVGKVTFSVTFGDDPRFIPSIYKVAVSALAHWHGPAFVLNEKFDPVRRFVLTGKGPFQSILISREEKLTHRFSPPYANKSRTALVMPMEIFGVEFYVDFLPEQVGLRHITSQLVMSGATQWTKLPVL